MGSVIIFLVTLWVMMIGCYILVAKANKVMAMGPEQNEEEPLTEEEFEAYYDGLDMLAICAMAEAEGESELGKRLVIDTILNRVDHPDYPDSILDVIEHPGAFTSFWNGRADTVEPTEEIFRLISEELKNRTNDKVLFFSAEGWPKYGTHLIKVGNHYFNAE